MKIESRKFSDFEKLPTPKSILTGNGLILANQAFGSSFNWESLSSNSDLTEFQKIILNQSDNNFEAALEKLDQCVEMLKFKGICSQSIEEERKKLRYIFLRGIAKCHPKSRKEFEQEQVENLCDFLRKFNFVYTLNYDFILYWAFLGREKGWKDFNDGFGGYTWVKPEELQTIFWMHGNLGFVLREGGKIEKIDQSESGKAAVEMVGKMLSEDQLSLLVCESSGSKKLVHINGCEYLKSCLDHLSNVNGSLFTFGCSFKNDEHILDAILKNEKLSNIYIGCYQLERAEGYELKSRILKALEGNGLSNDDKRVVLCETSEMLVWGESKLKP